MRRAVLITVAAVSIIYPALHAAQSPPSQPTPRVDFVKDVQPIFQEHCYECHGPEKQMNGFRLDRRHDAMRGGTINVITRGSADASRLYLRLIGVRYGRQMPVEDHLDATQIDTVKRWIDEGADWPDRVSGDPPDRPVDEVAVKAFDAIRGGDTAAFVEMLRGNANVSTLRGPGGATPLMAAALYGDATDVRTLLDAGADPNVADDAGATPLMWGIDDLEKVRMLVEHHADVNALSQDRRVPIMMAAAVRGDRDVVAYLLDHGANPSASGAGLFPTTALTEAAKQGDEATLRVLVEHGANVAAAGFIPLTLSMRARCDGCVALLMPKLPPPMVTPAMVAGSPPNGPALGAMPMLERGADPNAPNPNGYPVLLLTAASDAQPVGDVQALLAHGADVNARGPNGETALMLARQHGRSPLIDVLLKAGAKETPVDAPRVAFAPAHSATLAIVRSLPLLQRADEQFLQRAGCVSCHNNTFTAETVALARDRGFPVDEAIARRQRAKIAAYISEWRGRILQQEGIPGDSDSMSDLLNGLAAERYPADAATDAVARFIHLQQRPDGHWIVFGHRPPIDSSDLQATVTSMRALQSYAPPQQRAGFAADLRKTAAWIATATPASTQDRMYQLQGLHSTGAAAETMARAASALVAEQRPDGGWAQMPTLDSDAYATGEALVGLLETGAMTPTNPVIRRGVQYLLRTQLADGSWFVASRAIPLQPYFDAGFPHGRNQFISAAATNYATQALIYAAARKAH
jgi:ankyrin repeat protein/mono/diheme cytochrome c family protein